MLECQISDPHEGIGCLAVAGWKVEIWSYLKAHGTSYNQALQFALQKKSG